jgi:hypothetical protein
MTQQPDTNITDANDPRARLIEALKGATAPGFFEHLTERADLALSPKWFEALADAVSPVMAKVWDEALDHVWQLNDPAYTVVDTPSARAILTQGDVAQAFRENPYR